jgi:putative membrane protein
MKAGIKTPVLGRKDNVNAAASLALRDPEEADANAMFEAVRIFDNMTKNVKGTEEYEVATISGSDLEGIEADRQLVSELTEVLEDFPATDVILVTDGFTDEMVLPLIESRVPVTSVRRIVIKHSKSIEESAALFSRYMKILVENPRYSRVVLGLPGVLILVFGVLWWFGYLDVAIQATIIILGAFLCVRGFRLDKEVLNGYKWIREYSPPPFTVQIGNFSAIAGIVLILVGGYLGGTAVATASNEMAEPFARLPELIGNFLYGSTLIMAFGVCVVLSGRAIRLFFEHDWRLWRTVVITVAIAWTAAIFYEASKILIVPTRDSLSLVVAILAGIPVIVATVTVVLVLRRRYRSYFKPAEPIMEDIEES